MGYGEMPARFQAPSGKLRPTKITIRERNTRPSASVSKIEALNRQLETGLTSLSSALPARAAPKGRLIVRHSALVRVCHWVNAICFVVLLMSGMQIFNASPLLTWGQTTNFDRPFFSLSARRDDNGDAAAGVTTIFGRAFDTTGVLGASRGDDGELEDRGFPSWATLPSNQDLAMGRRWHFFFAWILVLNGLIYFANLIVGRHIRDLWPSLADLRAIPHAIVEHLRLRFPTGDEALHYNVLQRLAYLSVVIAFPVLILAGLTMSPAVNAAFPWLLTLFHGRQAARAVHFLLAAYLVLFVIVHLAMVVLSGPINNMRSMITGRYRIKEAQQ
jgi:thiosulfate reductase cytochrome b subunit